ncbi:MAG TPA: HXXEE domain-containing protein [Pyrinomonadaceae bacterium]|nr:HXXEE domain-containing protein [Pyrinomonadaceae bacterium]
MISPETSTQSRRLWLFLLVYPLHIIEEIRGVGAFRGINLSLKQFFILSGAACLLMVIGILLAQKFRFPQLLEIVFGTVFLLNGLSHIINSVVIRGYDAGLITGTLIFIPLGVTSLVRLRNSMRRLRYLAGVALGLAAQGIITVLAL